MSKTKPIDDRAPVDPGLDEKALKAIGRALQAHYDDLVKAPLPDRFQKLIASLDAADETATEKGADAAR
jgi:Anti-sigma factor NepR